eukprot:m.154933 g.154933  ORF g.154933 m.154933 type:complete len:78 (-) comp10198_c0_seq4:1268-1501(-)
MVWRANCDLSSLAGIISVGASWRDTFFIQSLAFLLSMTTPCSISRKISLSSSPNSLKISRECWPTFSGVSCPAAPNI